MNEKQAVEDFCARLEIDKENDILIYDPYIISTKDLVEVGVRNLVKIRRPGWGRGNVSDFVTKIGYNEFKACLEVEDATRENIRKT